MQTTVLAESIDHIPCRNYHHLYIRRTLFILLLLAAMALYVAYAFDLKKNVETYINIDDVMDDRQSVPPKKVNSPFDRTIAFIRWNAGFRERIPLMEKYRPHFAELHFSIPGYTSQLNYTADGLIPVGQPYGVVGKTMEIILQNHSIIEGLLYFHFDAWINPFKINDMNFQNIWFPDSNPPPFRCLKGESEISWWAATSGLHKTAMIAARNATEKYPGRYILTNENNFCAGWSDIYYIPRRFFKDFIDLADIYYTAGSFHEMAVPTIVKIIDFTYRATPFHSVITHLTDCWGNCCAGGARPVDIQEKRCGHRMDLANDLIRKSLTELLDSETGYLNRSLLVHSSP